MQNTTADYKIEINKPSRQFECKITIGNNIYTNEDLVNLTLEYTQPQEGFTIGSTVSQSLDLTLLNKGDIIYSTSQIKVEIGLKIGSTIEYILMGIFNIDDIEKTDYTTKFTAYDNMIKFETAYFSSLGDKPTLQQVVNELSSKTGVQFIGSLPSYTVSKLEGFSCREVLSYVASICGGNAFITRDGKFTIKSLGEVEKSIDGSNYFDYTREEVKYKVGQISCQVDENNILSKGSIGTDSMELGFENPWVTESILNDIYNKLNGLSYLGYSMKWQGDIALDPYDIITVTDVKNVVRKIPILSQKLTYTGGLTSEIGAKGETKNKNSFSSSGSTTNKINRLVTEQAIIKEALIDKANIKDLEASNAKIENLEAKTVKIEEAIIDVAYVSDLTAINANIQNLIAADATINNALIGKADITELNAVKGTINVLESDTANIKNLLAGNITGESGQLIHLTASNVVIADAVIKDLIAANISVEDLKTSRISTNKFTIASDNGGIEIVGATQQFKDKNNKVRIQMGQDTQGNFNFILRGEDGTTTLIDHTGIKEKAIADDLIKSNMVAADAIGEKQINYSSLITGLNKDTNTSLIKASKVAIDLTGQSLEVAFNSLKSNVDNIEIGGRNFIRNSHFDTDDKCGLYERYGTVIIEDSLWKFTTTQTHSANRFDWIWNIEDLGTYTLSIYAKIPKNILWQNHVGVIFDTSNQIADINNFKVYHTTFTVEKAGFVTIRGYMPYMEVGSQVIIDWIKLEKGTKPTDWTPAPEDVDSKIESNTTAITVAQGKIEGLISENSIIKGDVSTINDKYTALKATVDGINTTVASNTSSIGAISTDLATANALADSKAKVFTSTPTTPYKIGDLWVQGTSGEIMKCKISRASGSYVASDWEKASKYTDDTKANTVEGNLNILSGKVTIVENNYTSLSQNLTGFKTTVGNTYSTKTELSTVDGKVTGLTSRVSTAESSITQLNNQIALKVEATDVTEAINNVQIGGRNLLINSTFNNGLWSSSYSKLIDPESDKPNSYITEIQHTNTGSNVASPIYNPKRFFKKFKKGESVAISFDFYCEDFDVYAPTSTVITFRYFPTETGGSATSLKSSSATSSIGIEKINGVWQRGSFTYTFTKDTEGWFTLGLYISNNKTSGENRIVKYRYRELKVEEGSKVTTWTPAPEDIDNAITTVDTKITTTSNKVATIETNLNGITQRVSSTESTVSTHTTQLGTVDSRINTAKNTAISTAASDATSKANNAQTNAVNSAKSYTDGQITTVNKTITDKVAEIKLTTDSITQKVSSTETTVSKLENNTNNIWSKNYSVNTATILPIKEFDGTSNLNAKYWYEVEGFIDGTGTNNGALIVFKGNGTSFEKEVMFEKGTSSNHVKLFLDNGVPSVTLYNHKSKYTVTCRVKRVPRNVSTTSSLKATKSQVATIETNLNGITSRVSTTENNISTINGNISNLTSRMNSAEQKITDSAIISTVQSTINTAKTEAINSANSTTDKKLQNYATKASMELTASQLRLDFSSSGGSNLVKDGQFKSWDFNNSKWWWFDSNLRLYSHCTANTGVGFYSEDGNVARLYSNYLNFKPNTTYTLRLDLAKEVSVYWSEVYIEFKTRDGSYISTITCSTNGYTFTTPNNCEHGYVVLAHGGRSSTTGGYVLWVDNVALYEGTTQLPYSPHPDEVYEGNTIIDANGITVNNGALTIKNKAGTTVFQGDDNGNLTLAGTVKSQNGDMYVSLNSGGLTFQDWNRNEQMLRVAMSYFPSNRDMNGISFAMPKYSDFLRFSYIDKEDLTNGWSSSDSQYKFMDFWSGSYTVGGVYYAKGIHAYAPLHIDGDGIFMKSGTNHTSDIKGDLIWNGINGLLGVLGDNGCFIGYKNGDEYRSRIVATEGAHTGTNDQIKSWGNWNCSGYTVHNATFSGNHVNSYANEVTRSFVETHCIEAENKQVRINFTDIQLVDGMAILNIPKAYIGINAGYIINSIVKKGKGDVWVLEEQESRFIIEGTADIKVNIEIIINLEETSSYSLKSGNDEQLCIDMTTGQPIGA